MNHFVNILRRFHHSATLIVHPGQRAPYSGTATGAQRKRYLGYVVLQHLKAELVRRNIENQDFMIEIMYVLPPGSYCPNSCVSSAPWHGHPPHATVRYRNKSTNQPLTTTVVDQYGRVRHTVRFHVGLPADAPRTREEHDAFLANRIPEPDWE